MDKIVQKESKRIQKLKSEIIKDNFLYWSRRLQQSSNQPNQLIPIKVAKTGSQLNALCSLELLDGRRLWIHDECVVDKILAVFYILAELSCNTLEM